MDDDRLPRRVFEDIGRNKRGRSRRSWKEGVWVGD